KPPNSGVARAGEQHVRIFRSSLAPRELQVAVRVAENGKAHFTRVPGGTPSATASSDGSPVSPTAAARTIPFDSTPMSFAGLRFATMTTFLPTSSSAEYFAAIPATI